MVSHTVRDAYRQSEAQSRIHPVKLIHLLYTRVLTHLELAEEGIKENDPKKRGENLGKAIAIIAELNVSVRPDDESEAAHFLRGLYESILLELPKVSVNNDVTVLQRAHGYLKRLKEIWEEVALPESGLDCEEPQREAESGKPVARPKVYGGNENCRKTNNTGLSISA